MSSDSSAVSKRWINYIQNLISDKFLWKRESLKIFSSSIPFIIKTLRGDSENTSKKLTCWVDNILRIIYVQLDINTLSYKKRIENFFLFFPLWFRRILNYSKIIEFSVNISLLCEVISKTFNWIRVYTMYKKHILCTSYICKTHFTFVTKIQ